MFLQPTITLYWITNVNNIFVVNVAILEVLKLTSCLSFRTLFYVPLGL